MTVTVNGADPVSGLLDEMLSALVDVLGDTCPARQLVAYGAGAAWDGEQVWVRAANTYPSSDLFGSPDTVHKRRPFIQWTLEAELAVVRCVTGVQAAGTSPVLPSAAVVTGDAARLAADARALRLALEYVFRLHKDSMIRLWTPIGPQGNLAGSAITVAVPFEECAPTVS